MSMLQGSVSNKLTVFALLAGLVGSFCAGCAPTDPNLVLKILAGDTGSRPGADSLTIQIADQTEAAEVLLRLRIDGVVRLFTCDTENGPCSIPLAQLPDVVESLDISRFDEDGRFLGGVIFEGSPGYIFTSDDFSGGSIILYQTTRDGANVFLL